MFLVCRGRRPAARRGADWARGRGRVRLRAGTLYTALDRLRADELISVDREEIVDNRLRRYYRLTTDGAKVLAAEAARLQANASAAIARLNPSGELRS